VRTKQLSRSNKEDEKHIEANGTGKKRQQFDLTSATEVAKDSFILLFLFSSGTQKQFDCIRTFD
jgi:hypothetical protein